MIYPRKSFADMYAKSAEGQLRDLWKQSMQLMSAAGTSMLDDRVAEFHDQVCHIKNWADQVKRQTDHYPAEEVLKFVARAKTSSAH